MLTGSALRPRFAALAALTAVAAVTALIYALREVMPVEASGVLYLLPVLIGSSLWRPLHRDRILGGERRRVQLLPHPADRRVHDRRRGELGRPGGLPRCRRGHQLPCRRRPRPCRGGRAPPARGGPDRGDGASAARRQEHRRRASDRRPADRKRIRPGLGGGRARLEGLRQAPALTAGRRRGRAGSAPSPFPRDTEPSAVEALEHRLVPGLETLLAAARRARGTRGAGDRDPGAAPQRRGQDGAPALRLARPAHAADRDHRRRRRARLADAQRGGARASWPR